ncbi:S-adenosyl-L-methionine-dependent methyltransferase [Coniophora puteana RWD-64-598 SS2]|uniref:S-adenosyl-L-methionine-dependent methyltransferase n=1 Tax=Coniophora puteana (strain RWD-64-598) TaxID=741705 RepID=A0A5M3MCC3_CONPW|nr:S-adenosyl-L-methionine-dependent methyltransferase [Coniophora puteana RWD-64-598 SS2]EIW76554.1 S-adenosyl-L-methionine-dependent methyltransferase [Coniophora puteana RWD-64-598 SS2]
MAIEMPRGTSGHTANERHDDEDDADTDIDDGSSDTSSVLTEIHSDDIPSYFEERDERLFLSSFHSHGNYPLPVDAREQERLTWQHRTLHALIGEHYVGPVDVVLDTDQDDRRKRVLDLGTGTGCWALDMAQQFPSARFNAIDIVPIQTRHPPNNVHFEMHDITQGFRWASGTMDVVHARSIMLAVHDYGGFLSEIARVLRPGGLFLAGELEHSVSFERGIPPSNGTQGMDRFFTVVNNVLGERGFVQTGAHIPEWLHRTRTSDGRPAFTEIHVQQYHVPIGGWRATNERERKMGRDWRNAMERYGDSVKPMLLSEASMDAHAVDELVQEYKDDLSMNGMFSVYNAVWAIRAN